MPDVVPYETLVRWAVVSERLYRVTEQLRAVDERLGEMVHALARTKAIENSDIFWDELNRVVQRRVDAMASAA